MPPKHITVKAELNAASEWICTTDVKTGDESCGSIAKALGGLMAAITVLGERLRDRCGGDEEAFNAIMAASMEDALREIDGR